MVRMNLLVLFFVLGLSAFVLAEEEQQQQADASADGFGSGDEQLNMMGEGEGAGEGDDMSEEKMAELMKQLQGGGGGMGGFGGMDMMGGGMGGGRRYTRDIFAVEEDVPLIQCEACKALVSHVQKRVADRKNRMKKTKVTELEILEMLETICDPVTGDGEWITEYDIVEKDDGLVLEHKGQPGHCEEECKTIVKACENVIKEADSDVAELIYGGKADVSDRICSKLIKGVKGSCGQSKLFVPADRTPGGDNFKPKSEIDIALAEAGKDLRKKQEINPDFLRDDL